MNNKNPTDSDISTELRERMNIVQYILDKTYCLLDHYDNKISPMIILVGFDFTAISIVLTFLFSSNANFQLKIISLILSFITYVVLTITVYKIISSLKPHVTPLHKDKKIAYGLIYFKDIRDNLDEEGKYIDTLFGKIKMRESDYYNKDNNRDINSFVKRIIEDCGRDIYAHSMILTEKTSNIKKALHWIFTSTIVTFGVISIIGILHIVL